MGVRIHPIPMGVDCGYLVQDRGTIFIDGGSPGKINAFVKELKKLSVRPEEIKLIVITHGHWDHTACAKELKQMTGAKIAMHRSDKEWLEKGVPAQPPGVTRWGKIVSKTLALYLPFVRIPAAAVDVVIGDEGLSLAEYGISGRVVHTPGHSPGSVSVLLDTGDAFVGDMAVNGFPLSSGPELSIFAEDFEQLKRSWRVLLEQGAKVIYTAHGQPFAADIIREKLSR